MGEFLPRPAQQRVLAYQDGRMGVAAVPGSGKTWTLSYLAAQIIRSGRLGDDQEVLVVTLVNSAVDNFRGRINQFIQDLGLLPQIGYRVRTLHGLAHDIVRQRPDLAGLADNFYILDERAAGQLLTDIAHTWLRTHPQSFEGLLSQELEENRLAWVRGNRLPDLVRDTASAFIKRAKDWELTPEQVAAQLEEAPAPLPLAEMGADIYHDYQRALAYRGAVDFDDLIRLAAQALDTDPALLARLQELWPYVLEDEAQDSSRLQEKILRQLVGEQGNWVRVGDPNQAIFETFTTADPAFLRNFLEEESVHRAELPNSGRSTDSIMALANRLIDWTRVEHPVADLRDALSLPHISPTPPGDPQPNPEDRPDRIALVPNRFPPQAELDAVADSLERWLPDNPDKTVAVLVPRNTRGFAVVEELRRRGLPFHDNLRSASATRLAAGALTNILNYLIDPISTRKLSTAFRVWRRDDREAPESHSRVEAAAAALRRCPAVEAYLWPSTGLDWIDGLAGEGEDPQVVQWLFEFRPIVQRWQGAMLLPVDQLIITLAQDLFDQPADLALAHKLALVLKHASGLNPEWRLPELSEELKVVARNERRFIGFDPDDTGFDPEMHKGEVVVTTMHKAKGLEWDRVYLMSVNNYDFPSAQPFDRFIAEKWFIRDRLDVQAEALAQLAALFDPDEYAWYEEGAATLRSRLGYAAERLRLFYVGITRACSELIVTWNTGRQGDQAQSLPFSALQAFWDHREDLEP